MNAARLFIAEKLEAGGDDGFVGRDQLMALFEGWCRDNGYKEEDLSLVKEEMRRAFGVELTRLRRGGRTASGRERVRGWAGVRWRSDEDLQPSRVVAEFVRSQREQHQKAEQQQQGLAMKRGFVIRDQGELIHILEGQLTRLKRQYEPNAPAGGGTVATSTVATTITGTTDAPAAPAAIISPEDPQAAAEIDALMARLAPDDEPARPAGVAG